MTVADHHHAAERGVGLNAAEGLDSVLERMAQHVGGHRDRISGIVCEEPELVMLADFLIFEQVVDHVAPAERAGGSAMHQHHGDPPMAVRFQRKQVIVGCAVWAGLQVVEQPGQFPGPTLAFHREQGPHRGLIVFQRHGVPVDPDIGGVIDGVERQPRGHFRPG